MLMHRATGPGHFSFLFQFKGLPRRIQKLYRNYRAVIAEQTKAYNMRGILSQ